MALHQTWQNKKDENRRGLKPPAKQPTLFDWQAVTFEKGKAQINKQTEMLLKWQNEVFWIGSNEICFWVRWEGIVLNGFRAHYLDREKLVFRISDQSSNTYERIV